MLSCHALRTVSPSARTTGPRPRDSVATGSAPKFAQTTRYSMILTGELERVMGIEPTYSAWKAAALPLSYTRIATSIRTMGSQGQAGFRVCFRSCGARIATNPSPVMPEQGMPRVSPPDQIWPDTRARRFRAAGPPLHPGRLQRNGRTVCGPRHPRVVSQAGQVCRQSWHQPYRRGQSRPHDP